METMHHKCILCKYEYYAAEEVYRMKEYRKCLLSSAYELVHISFTVYSTEQVSPCGNASSLYLKFPVRISIPTPTLMTEDFCGFLPGKMPGHSLKIRLQTVPSTSFQIHYPSINRSLAWLTDSINKYTNTCTKRRFLVSGIQPCGLVGLHRTTRYVPEARTLHNHGCEKFKSSRYEIR
jgi:hypothetical protein